VIGFDDSQLTGLESLDQNLMRCSRNRSTQTENRSGPGNPEAESLACPGRCGDLDVSDAND
jgi:hypothetical protein